jgi:hypothetical protein
MPIDNLDVWYADSQHDSKVNDPPVSVQDGGEQAADKTPGLWERDAHGDEGITSGSPAPIPVGREDVVGARQAPIPHSALAHTQPAEVGQSPRPGAGNLAAWADMAVSGSELASDCDHGEEPLFEVDGVCMGADEAARVDERYKDEVDLVDGDGEALASFRQWVLKGIKDKKHDVEFLGWLGSFVLDPTCPQQAKDDLSDEIRRAVHDSAQSGPGMCSAVANKRRGKKHRQRHKQKQEAEQTKV